MRAAMSVAPPGANGTMNLTGFCGQDCAPAAMLKSMAQISVTVLITRILQGQSECESGREHERCGNRGETLLPLVPVEKLDRQHAQAAAEVGRQQHDKAPLGELDERLLGPAQEGIHLEPLAKRPEMHRQEERERDS